MAASDVARRVSCDLRTSWRVEGEGKGRRIRADVRAGVQLDDGVWGDGILEGILTNEGNRKESRSRAAGWSPSPLPLPLCAYLDGEDVLLVLLQRVVQDQLRLGDLRINVEIIRFNEVNSHFR